MSGLVARPRLHRLLDGAGRVALISAPAGSGKSMLVSTWLEDVGDVAWVGIEREEGDPIRFWTAVMEALRDSGAVAPDDPLATLTPAPAGGQEEFLSRLLDGLDGLPRPALLVLDDLHELRSPEALDGLERLLAAAPKQLRTVVISRRDPKLGLHRLRLTGELLEIRGDDLQFTADEAAELLAASGVAVGPDDVARLHERTEGWAAGLGLAALALAGHEAPSRFVAEFAGSERAVEDFLLDEVLAGQPPEVRSLLLRTCVLERVSGPLADHMTGRDDGDRILHELDAATAMVAAIDASRTWFRYHHLLADLLRLELRRSAPAAVPDLHTLAAGWHAEHGDPVEAIRHAELGGDWPLAGELLGRHWVHLLLDGEERTLGALLVLLPTGHVGDDPELATIGAADLLAQSRWIEADALIGAAQRALPDLPVARRPRAATALATVQLLRARRVGDLGDAVEEAGPLLNGEGSGAGIELEAFALLNLGIAETWTLRLAHAEAHLGEALTLARRIARPYLEMGCLTTLGTICLLTRRGQLAERNLRAALEIAERLGWSSLPFVGVACVNLGALQVDRGHLDEADELLRRGEAILADAPEPAAGVGLHHARGMLAIAREHHAAALASFREAERVALELGAPRYLGAIARQWQLRALLRLGDDGPARAALREPKDGTLQRSLAAQVHLVDGDAAAAAAALDGRAPAFQPNQEIEALLLAALALTRLGKREAAEGTLERALDIAERGGHRWVWLTVPGMRELLAVHPAHRTAHGAFVRELRDLLDGGAPRALAEPLNERELTVLRFLPGNLSAAQIGGELYLSVNTVKTHMRKLYAKLEVHTRAEAVKRGRALGLLTPPRRG